MSDRVEVTCPCCSTKLLVDVASGEILSEERPRIDTGKTFDSALRDVRGGEARRSEAFSKAFDRTRNLDELLSKKFEEAKKKAEREGGKPRGPFDLD
jgi:hypothetical protein